MAGSLKYELAEIQRGIAELELREQHPLRVYRPSDQQLPIHESQASENIVTGGKRSGKAQPKDEPILTPNGWRPIGELAQGDIVIGGDGKPCTVTGVFPQGMKDVFRVTFSDGSWTRCCGEHLWLIQTGRQRLRGDGQWQVYSAQQIIDEWGDEPLPGDRPAVPAWENWRKTAQEKAVKILRSIKPDGAADCVCISVSCPDHTYVTRDFVVTHNTLAVVMEFASRLLGIPIIRPDGTPIKKRFRVPSKRNNGLYWVIGLDVKHIGQTIYHRLFSPGLGCEFRILRDHKTKKWRAYNPNFDVERFEESVLSPPLFGEHLIVPNSWHMESSAGNIFHSVRIINGVTMCAYPTTGDHPKQGDAVHGIWLDEDTANAAFLKEWQDRLMSVRGWFLWSVWPKIHNEALIKTIERAKRHQDDEKPPIQVFQLTGSDNPYSDRQGIQEGLLRMDGDDDEAHRDRGDISAFVSGRRMYDFGSAIHVVKPYDEPLPEPATAHQIVCNCLRDAQLPHDWTRYLVIDPSHTRTACLFGVVPPPEVNRVVMGDRLIIERELIVKKHTPAMFAAALMPLTEGLSLEAFVMDQRAGRQTNIGNDVTVFESYEREFRKRGILSRLTKAGFMRGCDDKELRRRTVRAFLEPVEDGWPKLWISSKCHYTIKEFYSYRKKEVADNEGNMVPIDEPVNERIHDCMAATEYLCEYISHRFLDGTAYVAPAERRAGGSPAYHAAMRMMQKQAREAGGPYVHLGPGEQSLSFA